MSLFVGSDLLSQTVQLALKVTNTQNKVKVIQLDESKKSNEFATVSPKGESPALSFNGKNLIGVDPILNELIDKDNSIFGTNATEKKEVEKQLKFAKELAPLSNSPKDSKFLGKLHKINSDMQFSVFCVGNHLTLADLAYFPLLHKIVSGFSESERFAFPNLTRYFDFLQHYEGIHSSFPSLPTVSINRNFPDELVQKKHVATPTSESSEHVEQSTSKQEAVVVSEEKKPQQQEKKENPKSEKSGTAAKNEGTQKKGQQPAAKSEERVDISRIDIRVGKILTCKKHEKAESLYVEEIDLGEGKPRQVVSGLVKFIPLDQMQGIDVCVVCNLKPANLVGVKSEAMVLAASNSDHTQVELLIPPPGSKIGEKLKFDGYPGEPDEQLNPKKKVWEQVQPDLHSGSDLVAYYKDVPFKTSAGLVKVKSITNGNIK